MGTFGGPNKFRESGGSVFIIIISKKYGLKEIAIDKADHDLVYDYHWHIVKSKKTFYAVTNKKHNGVYRLFRMHTLIMGELGIDHIDHNGLNNRRRNLRCCSNIENCRNKSLQKNNKSGYKGVSFYKPNGMWRADIRVNKVLLFLGFFPNKELAAKEYNKNAKKYFGEFAFLNEVK